MLINYYFSEHIAPVLSLCVALNNTVIVSGGEDSRIIVTSIIKGDVIFKIDHHRGPVTAVKVTSSTDVLVSGKIVLPKGLLLCYYYYF